MLRAEPHVGIRRQMKDDISALGALVQPVSLEEVAFNRREIRLLQSIVQKLPTPRGKIVISDDSVTLQPRAGLQDCCR